MDILLGNKFFMARVWPLFVSFVPVDRLFMKFRVEICHQGHFFRFQFMLKHNDTRRRQYSCPYILANSTY